MKKQKKKDAGITLIALVISIIVMLILAGVSLNATVGENGIITQAQLSLLETKFASYKEELEMNTIDSSNVTCVEETMRDYIEAMEDEYLDKFIIANSELFYIGENETEKNACENLGIDTAVGSSGAATDIITIYDEVLSLSSTERVPTSDSEENNENLPGIRLYDKDPDNGERWNLIITYNSSNSETGRYGSGYYYLKAGTYTVNGEEITLSQDYVINYSTNYLIGLSNYKNWNVDSTLAVTNGLVLNIDPTNLATGEWVTEYQEDGVTETGFEEFVVNTKKTGIKRTGDVVYDENNKALKFNEDSTHNPNGVGGYMKLMRSGVDFSNGFSFEIYTKLSRLYYSERGHSDAGLFCRMPTLSSTFSLAMRFGGNSKENLCKFFSSSSWTGTGKVLGTDRNANVICNSCGYDVGEDFYLTFVYVSYDSIKSATYKSEYATEYASNEGNYDEEMDRIYKDYTEGKRTNYIDKVLYYVNGELYGYTYYGHDSYLSGCDTWNNDDCPFFVGVCPWHADGNVYYLKGLVYSCRLYQTSMTPTQVSDNRDATMQYRESF